MTERIFVKLYIGGFYWKLWIPVLVQMVENIMSILHKCLPNFVTNFITSITIDIIVTSASCITMVTFVTKIISAAVILMVVKVASVLMVTR